MALSKLQRAPRNPKDHDLGQLHVSVDRFGYVTPQLIDERTGWLVAGHGRLETLQQKKERGESPPLRVVERDGDWFVPVIRGVSFNSEAEAEAYLLADNKHVEAGGWKIDELSQMLQDLHSRGESLEGLGFYDHDIETLLNAEWAPPEASGDLEDFSRDSANSGGKELRFTASQWETLIAAILRVRESKMLGEEAPSEGSAEWIDDATALTILAEQYLASL